MNDTSRHRKEDGIDVMTGRKRLLITGSRTWPSEPVVAAAILQEWLDWGKPPLTLVHGGARGADLMAASVMNTQIRENGEQIFKVEQYQAKWDIHGKAAGHIRNAEMVALGADLMLAFIHNNSRGATNALELAERAGIPTMVYRIDDSRMRS